MIYKNFKNLLLPSLGVGTMRLPTLPDGTVDEEACREMFSYAMEHGVNYFDTAYGYREQATISQRSFPDTISRT